MTRISKINVPVDGGVPDEDQDGTKLSQMVSNTLLPTISIFGSPLKGEESDYFLPHNDICISELSDEVDGTSNNMNGY